MTIGKMNRKLHFQTQSRTSDGGGSSGGDGGGGGYPGY